MHSHEPYDILIHSWKVLPEVCAEDAANLADNVAHVIIIILQHLQNRREYDKKQRKGNCYWNVLCSCCWLSEFRGGVNDNVLHVQAAEITAPEESFQESDETGSKESAQMPEAELEEEPSQEPDGATQRKVSRVLEDDAMPDETLQPSEGAMPDETSQPSEDVLSDGMVQEWNEPLAETDGEIAIDETNFPDKYFREYLLGTLEGYENVGIDEDENGMLSAEERSRVTSIWIQGKPVRDFTGISYFPNLSELRVWQSLVVSVDLSGNAELTHVEMCSNSKLESVDLSGNVELTYVYLDGNEKLESIDLSGASKLTNLSMSGCSISELQLNGCTQLEHLNCNNNKLKSIDLGSAVQLRELCVSNNELEGLNLEAVPNLVNLQCSGNQLGVLDIHANRELISLRCGWNALQYLDVTGLPELESLDCTENQLTELNVTNNPKLSTLNCGSNQLKKLDISQNPKLEHLNINNNYIISLDASANELLRLEEYNSGWSTKSIVSVAEKIDDGRWLLDLSSQEGYQPDKLAIAEWGNSSNVPVLTERGVVWEENPAEYGDVYLTLDYDLSNNGYMDGKVLKCHYMLTMVPEGYDSSYVDLTEENFPDEEFRNYLKMQYDWDNDGRFQPGMITGLYIYEVKNLEDLTGLEFFKALTDLSISGSPLLTKLDVSKNERLISLDIQGAPIYSLDLRNNPNIAYIGCNLPLTSLYLAEDCTRTFQSCPITATAVEENGRYVLDLSEYGGLDQNRVTGLSDGEVDGNKIYWNSESEVPVVFSYEFVLRSDYEEGMVYSENDILKVTFTLTNNAPETPEGKIIALTEENFPSTGLLNYLKENFDFDGDGQLNTADVTYLSFSGASEVTSLEGVEKLNCLQSLYIWRTPLRSLDLSSNTILSNLCATSGSLTDINITGCPYLEVVNLDDNSLTNLDVSQNRMLRSLSLHGNSLISLDVSQNKNLKYLNASNNAIAALDLSNNSSLQRLDCSYNPRMASLNLPSQKSKITELCVMGNNIQNLQINELPNLTVLQVDSNQGKMKELDLTGCTKLQHLMVNDISLKVDWTKMTALEYLSIQNQQVYSSADGSNVSLEKLDLSKAANLQTCYVYGGSVGEVDVHGCAQLRDLSIIWGNLQALDLSGCTALSDLNCEGNQLQSLDVSSCTALKSINCSGNELQTLDIRNNKALQNLYCQSNKLSTVDTSQNPALKWFCCSGNPIVSLDLSNNKAMLSNLDCSNTSLTSLDVRGNEALENVCLDNQVFVVSEGDLQPVSELDKIVGVSAGQAGVQQNVRGADTGKYILRLDRYGNFDPSKVRNLSSGTAVANGIMWENKNAVPDSLTYDYDISNHYKLASQVMQVTVVVNGDSSEGVTPGIPILGESMQKKDLSSCSITISPTTALYTGRAHQPEVVVTDGGYILQSGIDYTIDCRNNIYAGNAAVVITGTGNYTGSIKRNFTIGKAAQSIRCTKTFQKVYGSKAFSLKAKRMTGNGKLTYISSNKKIATVSKNGKVTLKGPGIANITIRAASTRNYKPASVKVMVVVKPAKMAVKSLKLEEGKKLTVKWKKDTKATGYEIQYSTDKKFKKGVKLKKVSKNKTTSCTLTKLNPGKKYYVRIRACKTVKINGKKQVLKGTWGSAKQSKGIIN